jgi:hypothetical protein
MSTCSRCGKNVGIFHRGSLCDACSTEDRDARFREGAAAIAQIRASGGDDEYAKVSLARLLADEKLHMGKSAEGPTVAALAAAAVDEEVKGAIAAKEPDGEKDDRALLVVDAVASALPAGMTLAEPIRKAIQTLILEAKIRQIERGQYLPLRSVGIALHPDELALFEGNAELLEAGRVSGSSGGFVSARVRVSKNVSVGAGGFQSESALKRVEMRSIDHGRVTVTTDRVLFIGSARDMEFKRAHVSKTALAEPTMGRGLVTLTFHFEDRRNPVGFWLSHPDAWLLNTLLVFSPTQFPHDAEGSDDLGARSASPFEAARQRQLERQAAKEHAAVFDKALFADLRSLAGPALSVIGREGVSFGDFCQQLGLTQNQADRLIHEMEHHNLAGVAAGRVTLAAPQPYCEKCHQGTNYGLFECPICGGPLGGHGSRGALGLDDL